MYDEQKRRDERDAGRKEQHERELIRLQRQTKKEIQTESTQMLKLHNLGLYYSGFERLFRSQRRYLKLSVFLPGFAEKIQIRRMGPGQEIKKETKERAGKYQ